MRKTGVLAAVAAICAAVAVLPANVAADGATGPTAEAAKKKCGKGKVRKNGKCVKRRGGAVLPRGSYVCSYYSGGYYYGAGTVNIHGRTYDSNGGKHHPYRYNRKLRIVNFPRGPYRDMFARFVPKAKELEVYAAFNDEYVDYGDYLWTCSD